MNPRDTLTPSSTMTPEEVAEYLRISKTTLYRLIRGGEIPSFRVGVNYRFMRDEIEKWIAEKQLPRSEEMKPRAKVRAKNKLKKKRQRR